MASTDQQPHVEAERSTLANYFAIDVGLRVLLFETTLVALVFMVNAEQTVLAVVPGSCRVLSHTVKFDHSPALVYFVSAMCIACLYSLLTGLSSFGVIREPAYGTKFLLHFAVWDVLMSGIVASATGAAAAVAYIGLKGNSHVGWNKVCPVYDKLCQHMGNSVAISLFASILLVLLTMLSVFSIRRRIPE